MTTGEITVHDSLNGTPGEALNRVNSSFYTDEDGVKFFSGGYASSDLTFNTLYFDLDERATEWETSASFLEYYNWLGGWQGQAPMTLEQLEAFLVDSFGSVEAGLETYSTTPLPRRQAKAGRYFFRLNGSRSYTASGVNIDFTRVLPTIDIDTDIAGAWNVRERWLTVGSDGNLTGTRLVKQPVPDTWYEGRVSFNKETNEWYAEVYSGTTLLGSATKSLQSGTLGQTFIFVNHYPFHRGSTTGDVTYYPMDWRDITLTYETYNTGVGPNPSEIGKRNLALNPSAEQNYNRAWHAEGGVVETAVQ